MNARYLATKIIKKLNQAGFVAYFAGGWVRDHLMGLNCEDIDIATNAPPTHILSLFPQTILVGLKFGIVIVVYQGQQFEIATFRKDIDYIDGRKPHAIELASAEEDALRRDFTINGMFFDPIENKLYDFVQGQKDLKERIVRTIGDPYARFTEDRLRMVRAFRFAARFEFLIDLQTQEAIRANADQLFPSVAMERIWQEFNKMSKHLNFDYALIEMHRLELLGIIFPSLKAVHLNELKSRVALFSQFPPSVPTLWYLIQLFPNISLEEVKELSTYLHISKKEMSCGLFLVKVSQAVENDISCKPDKVTWTTLYAHPYIDLSLKVISLSQTNPIEFYEKHTQRIKSLACHIERCKVKSPLVNASILQACGITPGIQMGVLLNEAMRLSILHDFNDASQVIDLLKQTSKWKQI